MRLSIAPDFRGCGRPEDKGAGGREANHPHAAAFRAEKSRPGDVRESLLSAAGFGAKSDLLGQR
jgi:hypothetical protein